MRDLSYLFSDLYMYTLTYTHTQAHKHIHTSTHAPSPHKQINVIKTCFYSGGDQKTVGESKVRARAQKWKKKKEGREHRSQEPDSVT